MSSPCPASTPVNGRKDILCGVCIDISPKANPIFPAEGCPAPYTDCDIWRAEKERHWHHRKRGRNHPAWARTPEDA